MRKLHVQRVRLMTALKLCLRFMLNFINTAVTQSKHCRWRRQTLWPNSRHWHTSTKIFVSLHLLQLTVAKLCWECMRKLKNSGRKHVWRYMMLPRIHRLIWIPMLAHSMKS